MNSPGAKIVKRTRAEISIRAEEDRLKTVYSAILPDVKGQRGLKKVVLSSKEGLVRLLIEEKEISHLRAGIGSNLRLIGLAMEACEV